MTSLVPFSSLAPTARVSNLEKRAPLIHNAPFLVNQVQPGVTSSKMACLANAETSSVIRLHRSTT